MIAPKKTINNFLASLNIQFILNFITNLPQFSSRVALLESVSSFAFACFFSLLLSFPGRLSGRESTCWWRWLGINALEEEMAPTPGLLPEESPWTEEPGGLQSMRSQRVRHDWSDFTHTALGATLKTEVAPQSTEIIQQLHLLPPPSHRPSCRQWV